MTTLNSMQSTLRKFHIWLETNTHRFHPELAGAYDVFFGDREGLTPNKKSNAMIPIFNEWLMTDFSVNGFVRPIKKRKNFLDYFLKEESKNLTPAEKIFGTNLKKSFRSFYRVESTEKGMCVNLEDLFSGEKIQMWDVNTAKHTQKGDILFARIVENEKGKYIGGGTAADVIPKPIFSILQEMIILTHQSTQGTPDESSFEEFLKWNSYIYIRDIHNLEGFLKGLG